MKNWSHWPACCNTRRKCCPPAARSPAESTTRRTTRLDTERRMQGGHRVVVQGLEWNVDAEASAVGGPRCLVLIRCIGGLGLWCPLVRPVVPSGLAISPNCSGEYFSKRVFSDRGSSSSVGSCVAGPHGASKL